MKANSKDDEDRCQFWSANTRKCLVCNNGIFIPPDNHIETYCSKPKFRRCIQYALNSGIDIKDLQSGKRIGPNRRRYLRVQRSHQLTLEGISMRDLSAVLPSTVETLDISSGGMRISTLSPLDPTSVVQFIFGENFSPILDKAVAQVQWCNKQIDDPGYQVGVSFKEEIPLHAIDRYLYSENGNSM